MSFLSVKEGWTLLASSCDEFRLFILCYAPWMTSLPYSNGILNDESESLIIRPFSFRSAGAGV